MEGSQREETMKNRKYVLGLLVVVLVCVSAAMRAQAPRPQVTFTFQDVTISGAIEVDSYGINKNGAITGDYILSDGTWHGFSCTLNRKGACAKVTNIDDPNGTKTQGYGINSSGEVVGYYLNSSGLTQGFLYKKGKYTDIGPTGETATEANGISDDGYIVGDYTDSSGIEHGFLYNGTTYTTLDISGASLSLCWGIQCGRWRGRYGWWITLDCVNSSGTYDSYLTKDLGKTYTKIDVPGATDSYAHGVFFNNNVYGIVYTILDSSGVEDGVLYYGGKYYSFDDSKGTNTRADGVNDKLLIVGRYGAGPSGGNGGYGYEAITKK
jgi:probable HAF family extracellular repeat protein